MTPATIAPLARIGLRILGGYLIGAGAVSEEHLWIFSDPELIGVAALALSEGWYFAARKFGWAT